MTNTLNRTEQPRAADSTTRAPTPARRRPGLKIVAALALAVVVAVVVPVMQNAYYEGLATSALILVILATGWNIVGGYGGQLSFGHAAFYGLGAYAAAEFASTVHAPVVVLLPASIAVAIVVSAIGSVLVIPGFRARGPYFAILTLSVAEAFALLGQYFLPGGIAGIFVPPLFNVTSHAPYLIVLTATVIAVAVSALVRRSRLGLGLGAIRSDPDAAAAVGVPTVRVRVIGFAISAAIAGTAGALYALTQALVDPPTVFDPTLSVLPVLMVTLGGTATVSGPVIGAILWAAINDSLSNVTANPGYTTVAYGVLLVGLAIALPGGLVGLGDRRTRTGRALRSLLSREQLPDKQPSREQPKEPA